MKDTEIFSETDLTEDAFLDGRVMLLQPRSGYRAATDPVLLAAAALVEPGGLVLDAGCGAGAAMLCLSSRIRGLQLHGLEIQPAYADLARKNAARNCMRATVHEGDLFNPPAPLKQICFDLVLTNPPFFDEAGPGAADPGRDAARRVVSGRGAAEWTAACLARVRSGGRLAVIHLAANLPDILAGLSGAGDIAVLPLQPQINRPAKRVIVIAKKGARAPFRLAAPLILHDGEAHIQDADDFSAAAKAVLRRADALAF